MFGKGYFIKILESEGKYVFQLWYVGKQEMGYSKDYNTYDECVEGVKNFKQYLLEFTPTEENGFAKVSKLGYRKYIYQFMGDKGEVLYRSRVIETKYNCRKSLLKTSENFAKAEIK